MKINGIKCTCGNDEFDTTKVEGSNALVLICRKCNQPVKNEKMINFPGKLIEVKG